MSSNKTIIIREGEAGQSAYELAVANGFSGTEAEWLASLQGGLNGWSPVLATVPDGARRVFRVVDWSGGTGLKPPAGLYVGVAGLSSEIDDALDMRGVPGISGKDSWTPVLAVVTDGTRRVVQVADWIGGTGEKPTVGNYLGSAGYTPTIANAVDVRGMAGAGTPGTDGANGWSPILSVITDGARRVYQITDWSGGSGAKPDTGLYVGNSGLTATLADAVDVRGSIGLPGVGSPGNDGIHGWTPVVAVVADGTRRVLMVADWVGGTGAKPEAGLYVGASGFVTAVASAVDVRGSAGAAGVGSPGNDGASAWTPILAVVTDGTRRVLQVSDWTGGSGTKPTVGQYVGATGLTATLANAVDVRGAAGAAGVGTPGNDGASAWTPILAVVTDGTRRVLQVSDWTGGSGTKPTVGQYVGATGLTATLASAVDVRGAAGAAGVGTPGNDGLSAWTPILAVVTDGTRRVLQVSDWTGGSGTKPTTGQYVGATGLTATLASAVDVRGAAGAAGVGTPGNDGLSAWTPILAVVTDGTRRVLQVSDWTGGSGTKPTTGQYVGATGLTATLASAVDVRGAAGVGTPGNDGLNAWTPILAVVTDGTRRVHQVADWAGGSGTKPQTGVYLSATGYTTNIANAVDIRGAAAAALATADDLPEKPTTPANRYFTEDRALAAVESSNASMARVLLADLPAAALENADRVAAIQRSSSNKRRIMLISDGTAWQYVNNLAVIDASEAESADLTLAATPAVFSTGTIVIPGKLILPRHEYALDLDVLFQSASASNAVSVTANGTAIFEPPGTTSTRRFAGTSRLFINAAGNAFRTGGHLSGFGFGANGGGGYLTEIAYTPGSDLTLQIRALGVVGEIAKLWRWKLVATR